MIILPPSIQAQFDKDENDFQRQVENLHLMALVAKKRLFTNEFDLFPKSDSNDDKSEFVKQFDFIIDLALFPDKEILDKLSKLGFPYSILKWFTPLDQIISELRRLQNIDGLVFLINSHFTGIRYHIENSIMVNMLEGFGLDISTNEEEGNIIHNKLTNEFRRRKYNSKKEQEPKMSAIERYFNSMIDKIEKVYPDKKKAKSEILGISRGNNLAFYSVLSQFFCDRISKRTVYYEMFPLMKLIMKNSSFLEEDDFLLTDNGYNGNYKEYKIGRVQKTLQSG